MSKLCVSKGLEVDRSRLLEGSHFPVEACGLKQAARKKPFPSRSLWIEASLLEGIHCPVEAYGLKKAFSKEAIA